jgi:transcriptional accessory protein Tex/SPT6
LGSGVSLVKSDPTFKKEVGPFTFADMVKELEKPGRDPRDEFSLFQYRDDVHEIADLKPGMILPGIVTNVTNFGAFVDMGVHQDGLVHISQLSHKYVQDPHTLVKPGDHVKVKVLEIDAAKKQIALTMKIDEKPAAAERGPRPERGAGGGRDQRGGRGRGGKPVLQSEKADPSTRREMGQRSEHSQPAAPAAPSRPAPARPAPGRGDDRRPGKPQQQPDKNQFKNNPFAGLSGILKK